MMCMDVRRALRRDDACRDALFAEFATVRGCHADFDAYIGRLGSLVDAMADDEYLARPGTEALARAVQGVELLRHATPDVVEAFMATRLRGAVAQWGSAFGTCGAALPKARADAIVERARVVR